MIGYTGFSNWGANNRVESDFTQRYAELVFNILPPDAVLMTSGDDITLPLGYYHFVDGQRPDLRLVEMNGIAFPGNLHAAKCAAEFIAETDRPVFQT